MRPQQIVPVVVGPTASGKSDLGIELALALDLMRRANGRSRGRSKAARALWPDIDGDALLVSPLVAGDEQLGILCCLANGGQFSEEDAELLAYR